jgi:hypothetical protein
VVLGAWSGNIFLSIACDVTFIRLIFKEISSAVYGRENVKYLIGKVGAP